MAELRAIVDFLDAELKHGELPDYPGAHNGLQIENSGQVSVVGAAVDASLSVFEEAVSQGVELLIVHHGLFWQEVQMLQGAHYQKMKLAIENGMAVYSSHIPLDVHPVLGNNAQLAKLLSLRDVEPFHEWKGIKLGLSGRWKGEPSKFIERLQKVTGPLKLSPNFSDSLGRIGVITGGAGSEVQKIAEAEINTFVTGEGPHWSFPLANELGINVIHAGHYATETFGVRALAEVVSARFETPSTFIHQPTGL